MKWRTSLTLKGHPVPKIIEWTETYVTNGPERRIFKNEDTGYSCVVKESEIVVRETWPAPKE